MITVAGTTTLPTINSISPGVPQVGNSDQNLTVSGSNFQAPLTVTVFFPGGGSTNLSGAQIQNVTSASFIMRITFGSAGGWGIRVSKPDGSQSNTFNFTVQSPIQPPTIGSINPTTAVTLNADQDVAVYGNNFQQNLTVSVTSPDGGKTTLSSAQIIPITTLTSSSFLLRIKLIIAGVWSIRVSNPDGRQSNPFNFTVIPPTGAPNISSINPATLTVEQTNQNVTVLGSHFQPGLTVDLVSPNGQGTTLQGASQVQNITSTSFVMHVTLGTMGNWSIRVKNPDGDQSTVFPFIVSPPSTGTCSMQVTRLSQGNPDWNQPGQKYDSTDKTIGELGCALTSLTMALNFAGIQIDPGTLNAVMIGHGGYDKRSVNWKPATSYISNDQLKFDELRSRSLNKLEDRLCQGYPVIVGVDLDAEGQSGHFVLVTGKEGDEFTIKDPGYVNRTKLTDYNSVFESRGSVVPKNFSFTNALNKTSGLEANVMSSLSDMTISVGGNAELLIINEAGRRTGYDPITGAILEEIPNSVYFRNSLNNDETGELDTQSTHSIIISQATPGAYTLIVTGQDSGASEVSVTSLAQDGSAQPGVSILSVTQSGSTATYQINVASPPSNTIQLNASSNMISEGTPQVDFMVTRSGDTTSVASVNFTTNDAAGSQNCNVANGIASSRCDYISALGTVNFAAGEASKTISILIVDDAYAEGTETFTVGLNNPSGALLGTQSVATVTINDNDSVNGTNPIGQAGFFVDAHYADFLNRLADPSGRAFWTNEITSCGSDQQCIDVKRINVSAAYFLSIEFQGTGYLVERIYKAAYGDALGTSTFGGTHQLPVPVLRFNEFLADTQHIGRGVVVNQGNWQQQLEDNKTAFTAEFVQRSRFTTALPTSMTPAQFVDILNTNAGNPLSPAERNQLVNDLTTNAKTRAQVLRAVAEDADLKTAEFNRAFVLMQFFGYLRRNPNDPQDTDYTGYDFWLTKLNQFNGNFQNAEMVKAFITSTEYRQRFGP